MMIAFIPFLVLGLYARVSFGNALTVIDYNGLCAIWSDHNHGCTGSSETFGLLKGSNCSDISRVVGGSRKPFDKLNVNTCGTLKGLPVAWITIEKSGQLTFSNINGAQAMCKLDDFQVGSSCTMSEARRSPTDSTLVTQTASTSVETTVSTKLSTSESSDARTSSEKSSTTASSSTSSKESCSLSSEESSLYSTALPSTSSKESLLSSTGPSSTSSKEESSTTSPQSMPSSISTCDNVST
ncbi:unnamed protein product [Penicillium salamii]|uniref:Secreted protein n=1 Tax=Penicillium salamii TaxID=1612424 RepID=A0A9W4NWV3_9EURO|nr:unnamed protein product [Penicillium salamii]CAG8029789.1 unnamed protein product [Penicillium salamii]CAG8064791.1 unnamed protein product [Penicillium salamii]CAG8308921.1 unnamed protein product [Penicillium salamii]CAG8316144.1 unnamed protein product [Penicillium salamii]